MSGGNLSGALLSQDQLTIVTDTHSALQYGRVLVTGTLLSSTDSDQRSRARDSRVWRTQSPTGGVQTSLNPAWLPQ